MTAVGRPAPKNGFQPGNAAAVTHGGYAVLHLQPRQAEIADAIRPLVPAFTAADDVAVCLLALCLARIERVAAALADVAEGDDEPASAARLREELRAQTAQARHWLTALGMTPTSRAKLARDAADAGHADALREHLERNYPSVVDG